MSEINLKRFVDIDIETNVVRAYLGTRQTMVLFTGEGSQGTSHTITSLNEAKEIYQNNPTTLAYLTVFFENNGVKCLVKEGKAYNTVTVNDIAELDNDYIVIGFAVPDNNVEAGYAAIKALAVSRDTSTIYGINEKILLARTAVNSDADTVKNLAVKYSNVTGAEMTIGAYLTQINVYKTNSIYDYAFTKEAITEEALSDDNFGTTIQNNMNVDIKLANSVRNCGGNMKDGSELTNNFVRILLHQTLTEKLVDLLVTKIKGSTGVSQIYATCAQELEQYRYAGYLSTDKIWTNENLEVSYNNKTYTLIEKGTPIVSGYIIKVIPITDLTDEDKAAHKAPPIYIIIADQYGIRQITISGEVI